MNMERRCSLWTNRGASNEFQQSRCIYEHTGATVRYRIVNLGLSGIRHPNKPRIAGRYCLQRNLRRRHRPGLGRRTKEVKSALSKTAKPNLRHEKSIKLTDAESVKLKQGKNFIDKRGIYVR